MRCPGVFSYRLEERANGSMSACPLCAAPHRWDASFEEWVVDLDYVAGQ